MKRIVKKQCPMCGKTTYMLFDAEHYEEVNAYMVALFYRTKRKLIQEALPFLDDFAREFILTGYCPSCQEQLFNAKVKKADDYFNYDDIDNEVLAAFLKDIHTLGVIRAFASPSADQLTMQQKLYIMYECDLWDQLQVDESGNIVFISEE